MNKGALKILYNDLGGFTVNTLKETKILGFPLWMYLIFSVLMMVMAANDWMLSNMVGALAFAMIIGTLLGWVGDHIPVWKTWSAAACSSPASWRVR